MAAEPNAVRPLKPEPGWELVLKRNPVERLKQEKHPLGIRDELPALIAAGYEAVAEEDIVRLQWWGLYHDKPKIGTFMLRIKLPSGHLTPAKLRAIGEVSNRYGRGDAELATRQNIQLHYLKLRELPQVFAAFDEAGITTAGGCGDTVRNITGCPVQGLDPGELFDATETVGAAADFFYGNPDFSNLPRKHKYSIAACTDRCNAPEINCIALVGAIHEGREGFGVLVGGGLSSVPRLARDLGVFVPKDEAVEVLAAITGAWAADLNYRVSRVKARLKFMIDDIGAEGMRERVEERLGRALEDYDQPAVDKPPHDHLGIQRQKQDGLVYIGAGAPRPDLGRPDDRRRRSRRARRRRRAHHAPAELHRRERARRARRRGHRRARPSLGFDVNANPVRGRSIACTGEPHCNFSVTETKQRLGRLIEHLEARFGDAIAGLRLHLDGCPHACAQHWIGDLGFQGTTARDDEARAGRPTTSSCAAASGPTPAIGRPLFRRVPTEELDAAVAGLVGGWLDGRGPDESFTAFTRRLTDDELGVLAGLEPAKKREREEEAA